MLIDPLLQITSFASDSFATVNGFICDRIGKQRSGKTLDCIDAFARHRPAARRIQPHLREIGVTVEKHLRPMVRLRAFLLSSALLVWTEVAIDCTATSAGRQTGVHRLEQARAGNQRRYIRAIRYRRSQHVQVRPHLLVLFAIDSVVLAQQGAVHKAQHY